MNPQPPNPAIRPSLLARAMGAISGSPGIALAVIVVLLAVVAWYVYQFGVAWPSKADTYQRPPRRARAAPPAKKKAPARRAAPPPDDDYDDLHQDEPAAEDPADDGSVDDLLDAIENA